MRRTRALLLLTGEKLQTIASMVGYESAFALTKAFKREFHISPQEYREKAHHGIAEGTDQPHRLEVQVHAKAKLVRMDHRNGSSMSVKRN